MNRAIVSIPEHRDPPSSIPSSLSTGRKRRRSLGTTPKNDQVCEEEGEEDDEDHFEAYEQSQHHHFDCPTTQKGDKKRRRTVSNDDNDDDNGKNDDFQDRKDEIKVVNVPLAEKDLTRVDREKGGDSTNENNKDYNEDNDDEVQVVEAPSVKKSLVPGQRLLLGTSGASDAAVAKMDPDEGGVTNGIKKADNDDEVRVVEAPLIEPSFLLGYRVPLGATRAFRPETQRHESNNSSSSNNNDNNKINNEEEEVEILGAQGGYNPLSDFPHAREDCVVHPFSFGSDNVKFCKNCYCYACDIPASECKNWKVHSQARRDHSAWKRLRQNQLQKQRKQQQQQQRKDPSATTASRPPPQPPPRQRSAPSRRPHVPQGPGIARSQQQRRQLLEERRQLGPSVREQRIREQQAEYRRRLEARRGKEPQQAANVTVRSLEDRRKQQQQAQALQQMMHGERKYYCDEIRGELVPITTDASRSRAEHAPPERRPRSFSLGGLCSRVKDAERHQKAHLEREAEWEREQRSLQQERNADWREKFGVNPPRSGNQTHKKKQKQQQTLQRQPQSQLKRQLQRETHKQPQRQRQRGQQSQQSQKTSQQKEPRRQLNWQPPKQPQRQSQQQKQNEQQLQQKQQPQRLLPVRHLYCTGCLSNGPLEAFSAAEREKGLKGRYARCRSCEARFKTAG